MRRTGAIFLYLSALASIVFFVFLFLAIRCEEDDMIFSLGFREHSVAHAFQTRYSLSSFRPTQLLLDALLISWNDPFVYNYTLFFFYAALFSFVVTIIYHLLREVFELRPSTMSEKLQLGAISVIQATAIYFLCTTRSEIFAWVGATQLYLVPVVFALFAILLICKSSAARTDYFLLALSALFIAGGAEHIAPLCIAISALLLVYTRSKKTTVPPATRKRLLFFLFFLVLFFALIVSNPGLRARIADSNQMLQAHAGKEFAMMVSFAQPYKLIGLLLIVVGALAFNQGLKAARVKINFRLLTLIAVLGFAVCVATSAIVYKQYRPSRIWFPFDVLVYIILAAAAISFSRKTNHVRLLLIGAGFAFAVMTAYAWRHVPALHRYRVEFDAIAHRVAQASPGELVVITHFPPPDLVSTVDLAADPHYESNELFCRFYKCRGKVSLSVNEPNSQGLGIGD